MRPHASVGVPPPPPRRPARAAFAFLASLASPASLGAFASLGALAGSGCSLAVEGFVDGCERDADCREKGGAFVGSVCREGACRANEGPAEGGDLSCIGRPPGGAAEVPEQVQVEFTFVDLMSAQPIAGASFLACSNTDLTCERPLGPAALAGDDGKARAPVQTAVAVGAPGFGGYFQIGAPERESALFSFHPPLLANASERVVLGRPGQLAGIAPALGFTADPERTAALLLARDCRNAPIPDVTFELEGGDPEAKLFYGVGPIPSATAARTDRFGTAFAMNVIPGVLSFRMVHPARGVVARFVAQTRRDHLSIVAVRPGL
ncbi:MAG TPA: hypothetical protein VFS00_01960 [Polyangiaceae bacterium]|nr:hypothetical protein [Polyangiaceae bacterium]